MNLDIAFVKSAIREPLNPCRDKDDPKEWARFGLHVCFQVLQQIREMRLQVVALTPGRKGDGSPFTKFEYQLEEYVKMQLDKFYPGAGFWGEEKGDLSQDQEISIIIDPIDGTRSFLSGFDSFAVAMSVVKQKSPLFSAICSPSTGDIGFRIGDQTSKLLQLYFAGGKPLHMVDLPVFPLGEQRPVLLNLHASPKATFYLNQFYKLWEQKKVALVKSTSGSPSLAILEAAKGASIYVNLWDTGSDKPYDLLPAHHLLMGSQGRMLDKYGHPVDPWDHQGLFLCGCIGAHTKWIINAL